MIPIPILKIVRKVFKCIPNNSHAFVPLFLVLNSIHILPTFSVNIQLSYFLWSLHKTFLRDFYHFVQMQSRPGTVALSPDFNKFFSDFQILEIRKKHPVHLRFHIPFHLILIQSGLFSF